MKPKLLIHLFLLICFVSNMQAISPKDLPANKPGVWHCEFTHYNLGHSIKNNAQIKVRHSEKLRMVIADGTLKSKGMDNITFTHKTFLTSDKEGRYKYEYSDSAGQRHSGFIEIKDIFTTKTYVGDSMYSQNYTSFESPTVITGEEVVYSTDDKRLFHSTFRNEWISGLPK